MDKEPEIKPPRERPKAIAFWLAGIGLFFPDGGADSLLLHKAGSLGWMLIFGGVEAHRNSRKHNETIAGSAAAVESDGDSLVTNLHVWRESLGHNARGVAFSPKGVRFS